MPWGNLRAGCATGPYGYGKGDEAQLSPLARTEAILKNGHDETLDGEGISSRRMAGPLETTCSTAGPAVCLQGLACCADGPRVLLAADGPRRRVEFNLLGGELDWLLPRAPNLLGRSMAWPLFQCAKIWRGVAYF